MKVLHVNLWDSRGGAAIAASRLHGALVHEGIDSGMLVARAKGDVPQTELLSVGWRFQRDRLLERAVQFIGSWQKDTTLFTCSLNLRPNNLVKRIHEIDPDIVHLHWVGGGMLRIEDLTKIQKPIVWTLHDMWPFCGTEHYSMDPEERWVQGYTPATRPASASGPDWAAAAWRRKMKHWQKVPVMTISPSHWMRECAQHSALFRERSDCRHFVIANGLDPQIFRPGDKAAARRRLGLPLDGKPFVVFGAFAQISPMKGGDLLIEALTEAKRRGMDFRLGMFGFGDLGEMAGYPVEQFGLVQDRERLVDIYNAADCLLVPSRLESFGQTASESLACGTPVVCFDTSGLRDIVDHKLNGYRAEVGSTQDYVDGVEWCLKAGADAPFREAARSKAVSAFDHTKLVKQHIDLYRTILQHDLP